MKHARDTWKRKLGPFLPSHRGKPPKRKQATTKWACAAYRGFRFQGNQKENHMLRTSFDASPRSLWHIAIQLHHIFSEYINTTSKSRPMVFASSGEEISIQPIPQDDTPSQPGIEKSHHGGISSTIESFRAYCRGIILEPLTCRVSPD